MRSHAAQKLPAGKPMESVRKRRPSAALPRRTLHGLCASGCLGGSPRENSLITSSAPSFKLWFYTHGSVSLSRLDTEYAVSLCPGRYLKSQSKFYFRT